MADDGWVRFFDLHILCRWPLTPALPPIWRGGGRKGDRFHIVVQLWRLGSFFRLDVF
jgi:hypothetical protein